MFVRNDSPAAAGSLSPWSNGADRGQAEALGGALDALRDDLMAAARREIGSDLAAKVSASDIVQETFLAAGRDIAQFRGDGPDELRSWLKGILKHLVINTRRRYRETGKRQVGRETAAGGGTGECAGAWWATISASATSPSGCAMRREREHALQRELMRLPDHYRQVIQWRHQEHLSFDAIAGRLGVSSEAARKIWGRALLRLREALGPDHDPR